jgi:hypothetical protein
MSDDFERAFGGGSSTRPFADRVERARVSEPLVDNPRAGVYRPYGHLAAGDVCETCDVQRWLDGTDIPEGIEFQYRLLLRIEYLGEEEIKLFLPDCIIILAGKSLRDMRKKLARRQVNFILQFSPRVWRERPNGKSPIVESITIVRPDRSAH